MAEEQNQEPVMTPEEAASAQFQIQKIYTKDVSLELPNAPQIFQESGQADVKMTLSQRVEDLGDNVHEVVLTVTVTATVGERTAYLVEVAQGGIFLVAGFNEQAKHAVINTLCPGSGEIVELESESEYGRRLEPLGVAARARMTAIWKHHNAAALRFVPEGEAVDMLHISTGSNVHTGSAKGWQRIIQGRLVALDLPECILSPPGKREAGAIGTDKKKREGVTMDEITK